MYKVILVFKFGDKLIKTIFILTRIYRNQQLFFAFIYVIKSPHWNTVVMWAIN